MAALHHLTGRYLSNERRSHAVFLQSLAKAEKIQTNRGSGFFSAVSGGMVGLGEPARVIYMFTVPYRKRNKYTYCKCP